MTETCEQVHAFADGELEPAEADRFRVHLAGCAACRAELHDIVQLGRLSDGARNVAAVADRPVASIAGKRRNRLVVSSVVAMAAALAIVVLVSQRPPPARVDGSLARFAAQLPSRRLPGRLARPEASGYLPYDVARGGDDEPMRLPLRDLADMEGRKDYQAVATAYLLAGESGQAARSLARAPSSPAVKNDLAVVALAQARPADALALLDEVLASRPDDRVATWNRALALADLDLSLSAAEVMRALAAAGEPGWSAEAGRRAESLAQSRRAGSDAPPQPTAVSSPSLVRAYAHEADLRAGQK